MLYTLYVQKSYGDTQNSMDLRGSDHFNFRRFCDRVCSGKYCFSYDYSQRVRELEFRKEADK